MKLRICYELLVIAVIFAVIVAFAQLPPDSFATSLRLALITIVIIKMILFYRYWLKKVKAGESARNAGLGVLSLFIATLLLEAFFMFLPRTHGIGYSLANRLWFNRYWKPINSFGNRDVEPDKGIKTNVFFVGDSFTAGHGIKDATDRFSDIVKANLAGRQGAIQTLNLAHNSFDTKSEYDSMLKFMEASGIQPDFIVLQYYGNDIDPVARKHGLKGDGEGFSPYSGHNPLSRGIVNGSYLINFLYWLFPGQDVVGYANYLEKAYSTESIFNEHMQEILAFKRFADAKDISLLVIIFPLMTEIEMSQKLYTQKVSRFLANHEIDHVDLSFLFRDMELSERIVNVNDAHPSRKAHRLVGEELGRLISLKLQNDRPVQ
ncbi:MAG: SGNH/GDSL hydrolase family protein [Spirochaetales bacterium]|nr:SGNH/GDSL hydrolase family protein [Spirochaetales bacterium]